MSETATWQPGLVVNQALMRPRAARFAIIIAVGLFVLGLSASTWLYLDGLRLSTGADAVQSVQRQFDRRGESLLLAAMAGGVGCLFAVAGGILYWGQTWQSRLRSRDDQWRKAIGSLHFQLAESRKSEELNEQSLTELKDQISALTSSGNQLREQLDQVRKAEKTLSQQRQVLESSKTVLELHVQERSSELQRIQKRFELILNSAGEGICGLDLDGKAVFLNPAVSRIIGQPVKELVGKSERQIFGDALKEVPGLNPNAGERMFTRPDGSTFPVEFVKTPLIENGRRLGTVVIFKDITERKRVEEAIEQKAAELSRSNAELEQFAFVASHDLQEPLRKIQAFGDRLKIKCQGALPKEGTDYLERMQNASVRMRALIDDLLAFSRVIRSSEPFVPVDLGAITREVLSDLEVRMEKNNGRVEIGNLPTIAADPMQMRQLMLNLLGNALKFQPSGGSPVVKVTSRMFNTGSGEPMCELSVQDNGIGFDEKYLEKMFAVFQRLHGRNEYEGTGVGLAVCRRIADRHHGTITARGQLGKGSTFLVTLPVKQNLSAATK